MQIVILAGGKGTRMREKTLTSPKPLLNYQGKSLLEHKLEALPDKTTEVIIVIGYLGHLIKQKIGDSYNSIPVTYIEQTEQQGTAHALWQCKDILKGKFMVLMGDDIYDKDDLQKLNEVNLDDWAVLVQEKQELPSAQKFIINKDNTLQGMIADPEGTVPYNYLYTGACVLTPKLFSHDMVAISETEFGLPHTFVTFASTQKIHVFKADNWRQITSPEDLV